MPKDLNTKIMKSTVLSISVIFLLVSATNAQFLPNKIKNFLDLNYTTQEDGVWKQVPGACDGNKSVLTGDFDGDGQTDYLVRFKTGKTPDSTRLYLVAFLNHNGEFTPNPFYDVAFTGELLRSSSIIIKKGATVSVGLGAEGEGPNIALQTDAVTNYICETDASKTFVYKNGEMRDIKDGFSKSSPTSTVTSTTFTPVVASTQSVQPTPTPISTATPKPQAYRIYYLSGNWTRKPSDGSVSDLKISIVQTGRNFTLKVNENQVKGTIQGDKFVIEGLAESGTIEKNENVISWSDGIWARDGSPQANLPTNPNTDSTPTNPNLSGKWLILGADGNTISSNEGIITQNETGFVFEIKTPASVKKAAGYLKDGKLITGWETTGSISTDGKVIIWSDKTLWKRQ